MKVAVIKLGARIAFGAADTSGGNGEARSILKIIKGSGTDVDVYTKVLKKDKNPKDYTFFNIEDEYTKINDREYEALIVLNGSVNYFAGVEIPDQILNYNLINNFKGKVFYLLCDPSLPLNQTWPSIEKKEWLGNWKKEDILITRKDIIYMSQPYDLFAVKNDIIKKSKIEIGKVVHFPFEKFPCLNDRVKEVENPEFDILYGGTMRGNRRINKMVKFYFGYSNDLKVEMFGKIKPEDLDKVAKKAGNPRPPSYGAAIAYDKFMEKMSNSLSTIIIGDKWYEGKDMAQRCYESIWSNVITFIDIELDPEKRVYKDSEFCSKFNYVKNSAEVEKRIQMIKDKPAIRKMVIEEQLKAINFNEKQYCLDFIEIIKNS
jgi:hypothetical protein